MTVDHIDSIYMHMHREHIFLYISVHVYMHTAMQRSIKFLHNCMVIYHSHRLERKFTQPFRDVLQLTTTQTRW